MEYVNYAHRGASSYAPENTLRAFYMGLEMGANGIETDIQLTVDRVPVLFHDDTLERVTDGTGRVCDHTLAQLRRLRVRCPDFPERTDVICTLEELLLHFGWRDLTFAIELKQPHVARETLNLLERYHMEDKAIVTSFELDYLREAHQLAPRWRLGWLREDFTPEEIGQFRELGGYQLCPRASCLTPEKAAAWNRQGFAVRAWGIADRQLMAHAWRCGTDGMTVNFPDVLHRFLLENNP